MAFARGLVFFSLLATGALAVRNHVSFTANPIRRVVSMLQSMQAKVMAEGERDAELFAKFDCYCTKGTATLEKSIAEAENKIPQIESSLEEARASKKQMEADLEKAKADRADAKEAIAQATSLREKEHGAFLKESGDDQTNVNALTKAITALEKGVAGEFLQTSGASRLQRLTIDMDMTSTDRDIVSSFLSQGQGYAPQSGEIIGILTQMNDTIAANLAEVTAAENSAKANFDELVEAKSKQSAANTKAVEDKLTRLGEVGIEIVNMAEDLDDTKKSLAEDKKFLADLQKNCATREEEYEMVKRTRTDELLAIFETIKILNDDDALELFKKTLPSPSLLQTMASTAGTKRLALHALQNGSASKDRRLDLISLALRGRAMAFDKVIVMIEKLVLLLHDEQKTDDEKKAFCEAELDKTEDEKKVLDQKVSDLELAIEETEGLIETVGEEIKALVKGIKELDEQVVEATENRKAEHEAYVTLLTENHAAIELLGIAKNRLLKFYNNKLYVPPQKRELSAENRVFENMGGVVTTTTPGGIAGTGVTALDQVAPPPPPEAVSAYKKKGEESTGVMTMVDMLVADLDKEIQEAEVEEKDAQAEYEQFIADSKAKRAADSESITEKEGAKAEGEAALQKATEEKKAKLTEAMTKAEFIRDLHLQCDWLLFNYLARREARTGELASLKNAKAVLSGADYS